jgi:hypothetical protein
LHAAKIVIAAALFLAVIGSGKVAAYQGTFYPFLPAFASNNSLQWIPDGSYGGSTDWTGSLMRIDYAQNGTPLRTVVEQTAPESYTFNHFLCTEWISNNCKKWQGSESRDNVAFWGTWTCTMRNASECSRWTGSNGGLNGFTYKHYDCSSFNQTLGVCQQWQGSDIEYGGFTYSGWSCGAMQGNACTQWNAMQPLIVDSFHTWLVWNSVGASTQFAALFSQPSQQNATVGNPVSWLVNVSGFHNGTCNYSVPAGAENFSVFDDNGTSVADASSWNCDFSQHNYTLQFNTSAITITQEWSQDENKQSNLSTQFVTGSLRFENVANLSVQNASWNVCLAGFYCEPSAGIVNVPAAGIVTVSQQGLGDVLQEQSTIVIDSNWTLFLDVSNSANISFHNIAISASAATGLNYSLEKRNGSWQSASFNETNNAFSWNADIDAIGSAEFRLTAQLPVPTPLPTPPAASITPTPTATSTPVPVATNSPTPTPYTTTTPKPTVAPQPTVFPKANQNNSDQNVLPVDVFDDGKDFSTNTPTPRPLQDSGKTSATGWIAGMLSNPLWLLFLALLPLLWFWIRKREEKVTLLKFFENGRVVLLATNTKADALKVEIEDVVPSAVRVDAWSETPALFEDTILGWHLVWSKKEWKKGEQWRIEYALEGDAQDLAAARIRGFLGEKEFVIDSAELKLPNALPQENTKSADLFEG